MSHIASLLGSAGLKDAAQSLGRRLTIAELPESTEPVQQIIKQQRLTSKIALDEGLYHLVKLNNINIIFKIKSKQLDLNGEK